MFCSVDTTESVNPAESSSVVRVSDVPPKSMMITRLVNAHFYQLSRNDLLLNMARDVLILVCCDWQVEAILQRVHAFVLELQAMRVPELRRAPYLAELEIEKRRLIYISRASAADMPSARLAQSILNYFQRFSLNGSWLFSWCACLSVCVFILILAAQFCRWCL